MKRTKAYGLMAEFDSVHDLVAAANRTREAGYKKIDAYSPFPVEGLAEAVGFHHDQVPLVVLIGGIDRGSDRLPHAVLDFRGQLPRQCGWQALSLLAGVHRGDL